MHTLGIQDNNTIGVNKNRKRMYLQLLSLLKFWTLSQLEVSGKKYFLSCNFSYLLGNSSYSFLEKKAEAGLKTQSTVWEKKIKAQVTLISLGGG